MKKGLVTLSLTLLLISTQLSASIWQRQLWYNIESLHPDLSSQAVASSWMNGDEGVQFTVTGLEAQAFYHWPAADALRIHVYNHQQQTLKIWFSGGDGLFQQLNPTQFHPKNSTIQWFYDTSELGDGILLITHQIATQTQFSLHQLHNQQPPSLIDNAEVIVDSAEVTFKQDDQPDWQDYAQLTPTDTVELKPVQDRQYHVQIRIPWAARYGASKTVAVKIHNGENTRTQIVDFKPQWRWWYHSEQSDTPLLLSRPVTIELMPSQDPVTVSVDHLAYLRWLASDHQQQMLLHDQDNDFEMQKSQHSGLDAAAKSLSGSVVFDRSLPPSTATELKLVQPITIQSQKNYPYHVLSALNQQPDLDYLYQINGQQTLEFTIPKTSNNPKLSLSVQASSQVQTFSLIADSGERHDFRVIPTIREQQNLSLTLSSTSHLLAEGITPDATIMLFRRIQFNKPFRTVTVKNNSGSKLALKMAYQNQGAAIADDQSWLAISKSTAQASIAVLANSAAESTELANQHPLLAQELDQWNQRLQRRAFEFEQRYTTTQKNRFREHSKAELTNLLTNASHELAQPIRSLTQLAGVLTAKGESLKARRLVAYFALAPSTASQQEAQALLITMLVEQQRWFDLEGYFAWRLLQYQQNTALPWIALTWFAQERYQPASRLFWLYGIEYPDSIYLEAMIAALLSEQLALLNAWTNKLDSNSLQQWRCLIDQAANCQRPLALQDNLAWSWQKHPVRLQGESKQQLIHNQLLDLYFTTLQLNPASPLNWTEAESGRYTIKLYPELNQGDNHNQPKLVNLSINGKLYRLPLLPARPSNNLAFAQSASKRLAAPQQFEFDLIQDNSQLALSIEGGSASFSLEKRYPIASLIAQKVPRFNQPKNGNQIKQWSSEQQLPTEFAVQTDPAARLLIDPPAQVTPGNTPLRVFFGQQQVATKSKFAVTDSGLNAHILQLSYQALQSKLSNAEVTKVTAQAQFTQLDEAVQRQLDQLNQQFTWQRLESIAQSSGVAFIESNNWLPAAEYWRIRKGLLKYPVKSNERKLTFGNLDTYVFNSMQAVNVTLNLRQATEFTQALERTSVSFSVNGKSKRFTLDSRRQQYQFQLPAGQSEISIKSNQAGNAIILYSVINDSTGESVLPVNKVKMHKATQSSAIKLYIPTNSYVRIDSYDPVTKRFDSQYRWYENDGLVTFNPQQSRSETWYRFYRWAPRTEITETTRSDTDYIIPFNSAHTYWPLTPTQKVKTIDRYPLAEQEDGSWGISSSAHSRRNFDEAESQSREDFIQLGWLYRLNIEDWDSHWYSSIQWREHDDESLSTLLSENKYQWHPNRYFDLIGHLDTYYQVAADDSDAQGEWSLYSRVDARWKSYWNTRTRNTLQLSGFARYLSVDSLPEVAIDDDIASNYKLDHSYGLALRDTLTYYPWLDTQLQVSAAIISNAGNQQGFLDRWSLNSRIAQYYHQLTLSMNLGYTQYQQDQHRLQSYGRTRVALAAKYDLWQTKGSLWQLEAEYSYDFGANNCSVFFGLTWNKTDGQGYDDFMPANLGFADLKRRHTFQKLATNELMLDDHD